MPEGFDFYGITSVTPQYYFARLINNQIKGRRLGKTIIGGAHASILPKQCIEDGFDYVVRGYGEIALLNIVRGSLKSKTIIEGELVNDLDSLPFPAWDDLLETDYNVSYGHKTAHLFTMRGCPYKCYYCCSPIIYGTNPNYRSIENIIDEIEFLITRYNMDSLYFFDPTFTLKFNKQRIIDLAERLKDYKLNWTCQTRVDQIDKDILHSFESSGCNQISFGIETFAAEVYDILGKETTVKQNELAIKMAHESGLKVKSYLMGALPNDNWETLEKFKKFIMKNRPDSWLLSTFIPFPGTPPWQDPERFGIKILCRDFRTYYPLGINGKGPVNISNRYLSRDDLVVLRNNMVDFLRQEIPNTRVDDAIMNFAKQKEILAPFFEDLNTSYVF